MKISKLDIRILNVLLENSRLSYRQIAKMLHVSAATVMNHIKDLEEKKIIKRYTAELSFYKLGYEFKAIIEMKISKGKLFEVERKIAQNPHVYAVYDVTGEYDAVLITRFRTRDALDRFLKQIQTFDFVERTHTSLILNVLKERQDAFE